jgi:predicted RNase H-like nuclease (RuvC/YqgF family)
MAGATGLRFTFPRHDIPRHDSPLFERMGTDEYAQLQDARQVTNSLQQRVHDLERINHDLEYRLEDQATQCMEVEKECVSIERIWKAKCEVFENEIKTWKQQFEAQKLKGDRVREHLSRTERELYGMLQRKYELIRGPGGRPTGERSSKYVCKLCICFIYVCIYINIRILT